MGRRLSSFLMASVRSAPLSSWSVPLPLSLSLILILLLSLQRHEYRSGIVKTVYADGTQETRFPNGRLRIKDKHDKVVVDSMLRTIDQLG